MGVKDSNKREHVNNKRSFARTRAGCVPLNKEKEQEEGEGKEE